MWPENCEIILCKKRIWGGKLIWTNIDSSAIYLSNILCLNLLNTRGPGTSFQVEVLKFFDKIFPFVIWHKQAKFHFTFQIIQ